MAHSRVFGFPSGGTEKAGAGRHFGRKQGTPASFDGQTWLLLAVNGLFGAASALSGTFVHIYLWKLKNDLALIGWFSLVNQATMGLTFWLAGKWVKQGDKMHSLRLGVAVSALFYALVLMLQERAANVVWLLGGVQGMAAGLFWLAFNVVYFEITDAGNRDRFNGWAGLLGSLSGMVAPWLSGMLITTMPGTSGYRLIFTISLGIFVGGVIVSFFLRKRKVNGHYEWLYGLRVLKGSGNGAWRRIFAALAAQGVREGVFAFAIGLLIYMATQDEMRIGQYSLITSAVALVSFYAVGKWFKPAYRKPGMLLGVSMMIAVIVPFFWQVSYTTLLIFGVGVSLFIPLYVVPMTSSVFDKIGHNQESVDHRVEFVVLREIGLTVGRVLGTLVFIAVVAGSPSPSAVNWMLLGIGSSPVVVWLLMRNLLATAHNRAPETKD